MSSLSSRGKSIEVQDLLSRFTLDAASEALFGAELNSLRGALPVSGQTVRGRQELVPSDQINAFAQAFEGCQDVYMGRITKGYFWPVTQLVRDDMTAHVKVIEASVQPLVARALERKAVRRSKGLCPEENDVFLDHLADQTNGRVMSAMTTTLCCRFLTAISCLTDPKVIQDQLTNILLAGRDTTACLLTFVIYFMSLHPDIAHRTRSEVVEQVGSGIPTFEDIKSLRYG